MASSKLSKWYYSCAFMPFINARRGFWSSWRHFLPPRLALCCGSWSQPVFLVMVRRWLSWRFSSSYCDIHCRNVGRALHHYWISLQDDRPVYDRWHGPCVQIQTMGPLSYFRRDSGCTCCLGWCQAFKAEILFSISQVEQTTLSRYSDPGKCRILP